MAGAVTAAASSASLGVTGLAWLSGTTTLLSCAASGQVQAWALPPEGGVLQPALPPAPLSKAACSGAAWGLAVSGNGAFVAVARAGNVSSAQADSSNKCASLSLQNCQNQCLNLIRIRNIHDACPCQQLVCCCAKVPLLEQEGV